MDIITAKFVARSDDILIFMPYRNESTLTQCMVPEERGFRPVYLRFRPVSHRIRLSRRWDAC